jgi:hypothetical protein
MRSHPDDHELTLHVGPQVLYGFGVRLELKLLALAVLICSEETIAVHDGRAEPAA